MLVDTKEIRMKIDQDSPEYVVWLYQERLIEGKTHQAAACETVLGHVRLEFSGPFQYQQHGIIAVIPELFDTLPVFEGKNIESQGLRLRIDKCIFSSGIQIKKVFR